METMKFTTNIKCGGCIAKVGPALDQLLGKGNWSVDLSHPNKILVVKQLATDAPLSSSDICAVVQKNGFSIEEV